jgi:predicted transcriptional regulator
MEQIANAVEERKRIGRITDFELYDFISENPGLSAYEIANKLNWSLGKVSGALSRLIKRGLLKVKEIISNPHPKKAYYPANWKNLVDWDGVNKEELKEYATVMLSS